MKHGNAAHGPIKKEPGEAVLAAFQDVGQILSEARREQNLTIKQVADKIHIRQQYLINLEEGQLSELPGWVYILGFIRIYARFLNLDGEEMIRHLQTLPKPTHERSQLPTPLQSEEGPNSLTLIASATLIILIAIGGYFFLRPAVPPSLPTINETLPDDSTPSQTDKTEPPSAESSLEKTQPLEPLLAPPSSAVPSSVKEELPQPLSPKKVTLKATEPSWVEIRDEAGRVIFMRVLKKGEEYVVPNKPGATISTGNAGGVDIFVGDTKLPPLGIRGDVKREIRLETLQ